MITSQALLFLIFVINGMIIGLLFDFFRVLRKVFNTSDFITYIQDILFWVFTGFLILYSIFVFNNGEIRFFMFFGVVIGITLYILLISNYIIKINVYIFNLFKNIINKIIKVFITPVKKIIKSLIGLVIKPIKKLIKYFKIQKSRKKSKKKKDF